MPFSPGIADSSSTYVAAERRLPAMCSSMCSNWAHPIAGSRLPLKLCDITRKIDEMLASSREGAPLSTYVASTVLGDDSTTSDVRRRAAG